MNQMYVEANKSYEHGFILTEQELRRFNELIKEQVKKINPNANIVFSFNIKFQNGVVAETENIDSVLTLENEGSKKIIFLGIEGKDDTNNSISFYFYNVDSDNIDTQYSIKYSIRSSDRDWVFVTSSLIEERIIKIKRRSFIPKSKSLYSRIFTLLIPLIFMISFLVSLIISLQTKNN